MKKNQYLIKEFIKAHPPKDGSAAYQQVKDMERIQGFINHILGDVGGCDGEAISSHTSTRVVLPVVEFKFSNDANIVIRDNFYDYSISVVSPDIDIPQEMLDGIRDLDEEIHSCYCQGFPKDRVYGTHTDNPKEFTFQTSSAVQVNYFIIAFAKLQKQEMIKSNSVVEKKPLHKSKFRKFIRDKHI